MQKWLENLKKMKDWAVVPSPPDPRDYPLKAIVKVPDKIPDATSIGHLVPFIMDQKETPFCAGFAMTNILNAYCKHLGIMPEGGLSPVFTYWMSKEIDGIPDQPGTYLRSVLKIAQKYGICSWNKLPFTGSDAKPKITQEMLDDAQKYRIKSYARLNDYDEICQAIACGKFVLIGTIVTSINWADGYILQPHGYYRGGHATFIEKYNNKMTYENYTKFLGGVNSWGTDWGFGGRYWMAEEYTKWRDQDFGLTALMEAWAVEIDKQPEPREIVEERIEKKEFLVAPFVKDGRTFGPFREIAESLGGAVDWDAKTEKVTMWFPGKKIEMWIGKKEYVVTTL